GDAANGLMEALAERQTLLVHGASPCCQLLPAPYEFRYRRLSHRRRRGWVVLKRCPKLLRDFLTRRLVTVELKCVIAETSGAQAFLHNLKRGSLLADEENRLPLRKKLGDHVRNRLTLSSPRRSVHHEAPTVRRRGNALTLRYICVENRCNLLRRSILIEPLLLDLLEVELRAFLRSEREGLDERVI